eukprot:CAMPEP_0201552642 /NCGR_PEP_ID=MMETSP0173_2-20130828/16833_1 /ASSEMBLY_ACC=CAM_ASM_000268 /TAXON_ID=218659 /ORGANISM="Vexillifera sp., Strain DIVA3 564/2" /LENGTH=447 /DNA_ID=CAMNT_0047963153 /DNA_START=56 /DNA_END=1395 /DNA_ORIENTATION=+
MAATSSKKTVGPNIPPLVTDCIRILEEKALKEEGILRVSGSEKQLIELSKQYQKKKPVDLSRTNVHTVAGLLKRYFKNSPESLLTFEMYDDFLATAGIQDVGARVERIRDLVEELPIPNQEILHRLLVFIVHVSEHAEENNMHKGNLSTMFGPQLLRRAQPDPQQMMQDMQSVFLVLHTMIDNYKEIFPDWPDDQDNKPGTPAPVTGTKKEIKRKIKIIEKALTKWYGKQWKRDSALQINRSRRKTIHGGMGGITVPGNQGDQITQNPSSSKTGTIDTNPNGGDATSSSSSSSSSTDDDEKITTTVDQQIIPAGSHTSDKTDDSHNQSHSTHSTSHNESSSSQSAHTDQDESSRDHATKNTTHSTSEGGESHTTNQSNESSSSISANDDDDDDKDATRRVDEIRKDIQRRRNAEKQKKSPSNVIDGTSSHGTTSSHETSSNSHETSS